LARPNQLLDCGGPEGETLIDVAFRCRLRGPRPRSRRPPRPREAERRFEPRRANAGSPCPRRPALCAARAQASRRSRQIRSTKAKGESADGVDGDQRMRRQTKATLVHADARSCPESQARAGRKPARKVRAAAVSTIFLGRHPPIVQKAADPHLARPIAAKLANARALAAARHKPGVQKGL
jgi:hypothetical protein